MGRQGRFQGHEERRRADAAGQKNPGLGADRELGPTVARRADEAQGRALLAGGEGRGAEAERLDQEVQATVLDAVDRKGPRDRR